MAGSFQIKRIYAPAADHDGFRVLVDRLWPRGVKREGARIDLWAKDVAPSDALRREFHGHPERWDKFVAAYRKELAREPAASAARDLLARRRHGRVTLLYAARDEAHNNAVALKGWLDEQA
ncbi:MAG: hypothetical protein QOF41_3463 [Methylobacteriaceae bacterium]|nr:hypothetical protein [Methylobacteriaceae bacterium]